VASMVAQEVPASSTMAVLHGPSGVGAARHRMRGHLHRTGVPEPVVDDAVLVLSELLSNAWRHGRPLGSDRGRGTVRAAWHVDERDRLTVEVTDGGGMTRPLPATPSVTARGGRGLNIITAVAEDWGVRYAPGEVTVWAVLPSRDGFATRVDPSPELSPSLRPSLPPGLGEELGAGLGPGLGPAASSGRHPRGSEFGFLDLDEPA
jgi:anti-sigma regulatory factor (Ser/Thr protein kinase)